MLPVEYGYLVASCGLLIPWLIVFLRRPDERREIMFLSVTIGILSVCTAYLWWTHDWWLPATITGTRVGIEDFIAGFTAGGIIAAGYEILMRRRHFHSVTKKDIFVPTHYLLLFLAVGTAGLIWLGFHSFYASAITMIIVSLAILVMRPDLVGDSLISGAIMAVTSLVFAYLPVILLSPDWVTATYMHDRLSGVYLITVPVEEFIFWFLAGMLFGPWYKYWKHERLRAIPRTRI